MKLETVGYFWAARRKDTIGDDFVAPIAYGEEGMPSPDMLLRDRGASLFETPEKAVEALEDTMNKADAKGSSWHKSYAFFLVSIKKQPEK